MSYSVKALINTVTPTLINQKQVMEGLTTVIQQPKYTINLADLEDKPFRLHLNDNKTYVIIADQDLDYDSIVDDIAQEYSRTNNNHPPFIVSFYGEEAGDLQSILYNSGHYETSTNHVTYQ